MDMIHASEAWRITREARQTKKLEAVKVLDPLGDIGLMTIFDGMSWDIFEQVMDDREWVDMCHPASSCSPQEIRDRIAKLERSDN